MNSFRVYTSLLLVCVACAVFAPFGHAAAEAPISPEPGDSPAAAKALTPEATAPQEESSSSSIPTVSDSSTPSNLAATKPLGERRIEQRVDGTKTEEVIRITPRPKKNVSRIDNKPNRPVVKPIAVIKGPVAPWGYATRYMNGEVNRPSAKELQGTNEQPGQPGAQAATQGGAPRVNRSRARDDR